MNPFVTSFFRHIGSKLAGVLVTHGYMTQGHDEELIGIVLFLVSIAWSYVEKRINKAGLASDLPKLPILALMAGLSLCLAGCTSFSSHLVKHPDGSVESVQRVTSVFDSKSNLAKLRTTQTDKSQGLSLAGLEQESSATNAVELLRLVGSILANIPK